MYVELLVEVVDLENTAGGGTWGEKEDDCELRYHHHHHRCGLWFAMVVSINEKIRETLVGVIAGDGDGGEGDCENYSYPSVDYLILS